MSFNYHALLSLNIQGRNAPPCPRSEVARVCALRLNEWLLLNVGVSLRKACVGRYHEAVSFRPYELRTALAFVNQDNVFICHRERSAAI